MSNSYVDYEYEKDLAHKTEIKRNPKWKRLDLKKVKEKTVFIDEYERVMILNNCPTEEAAIKAILNKRKNDTDYESRYGTLHEDDGASYHHKCKKFKKNNYDK